MSRIRFGANAAKFLSVFLATLLWFHVASRSSYNDTAHIPIVFTEPSDGYLLTNDPPKELIANIKGSGKQLIVYRLKKMFNPLFSYVTVNISDLQKGKHLINIDKNSIYISDEKGISATGIDENAVFQLIIDKKITRTLRVNTERIDGLSIGKNYVSSGKPAVNPEFVTVEGPEDFVDSIKTVGLVAPVKTVITADSPSATVKPLNKNPLIKIEPSEIIVRYSIESVITKKIEVPVKLSGFPRKTGYTFSPDTVSVAFSGPESVINSLGIKAIKVYAEYDSFIVRKNLGQETITLKIKVPDGITGYEINPEKLSFKPVEPKKSDME